MKSPLCLLKNKKLSEGVCSQLDLGAHLKYKMKIAKRVKQVNFLKKLSEIA